MFFWVCFFAKVWHCANSSSVHCGVGGFRCCRGMVDTDTLRILVATDCHLGYMEKDEVRRHDSFNAFDEICAIASQRQASISLFFFFFSKP
jgi:hypothetical protein